MDEKEILRKASELGFMIHGTLVYREYERLSGEVNRNPDARLLLEDYSRIAADISSRESSGQQVDDYEKDELRELVEQIKEEELLVEFIQARDRYISLLESIQSSLIAKE